MDQNESLDGVNFILAQCCFLRVIPYTWDSKTRQLKLLSGPGTWTTIVICLYVWGYSLFIVTRYPLSKAHNSTSDQVLHVVFMGLYGIGSLVAYNNLSRRFEIGSFMNNYLYCQKWLEAQTQGLDEVQWKWIRLLLKSLIPTSYVQSVFAVIVFLETPGSPRYLYSWAVRGVWDPEVTPIHEGHATCVALLVTFAILEFISYFLIWHITFLSVIALLSFWPSCSSWLKGIKLREGPRHGDFSSQIGSPQMSLKVFKTLSVLTNQFNLAFSDFLLIVQFMLILVPVTCNFVLIRFHVTLNQTVLGSMLIIGCTIQIIVFLAFPKGAGINTNSKGFISSLLPLRTSPSSRKEFRSFRPTRIWFGSLFFLSKFTPLRIFGLIIYWTMKSLLLF